MVHSSEHRPHCLQCPPRLARPMKLSISRRVSFWRCKGTCKTTIISRSTAQVSHGCSTFSSDAHGPLHTDPPYYVDELITVPIILRGACQFLQAAYVLHGGVDMRKAQIRILLDRCRDLVARTAKQIFTQGDIDPYLSDSMRENVEGLTM